MTDNTQSGILNTKYSKLVVEEFTPIGYIYILHSKCLGNKVKLGSTLNIRRRKWDYFTSYPDAVMYCTYFEILSYKDIPQNLSLICKEDKNILQNKIRNTEYSIYKHTWFMERKYNKEYFILDISEDTFRDISTSLGANDDKFIDITKDLMKNLIFNNAIRVYIDKISDKLNASNIKFRVIEEDILHRERKGRLRVLSYEKLMMKYGEEENIIDVEDGNYDLRPYQLEAIELMCSNNIGKFILPTGTGKTIIFLSYLSTLKKSLVLVPYIDLVYQTREKALKFPFTLIKTICNGKTESLNTQIGGEERELYISTYQSSNREKYSEILDRYFDCIIFDEVHYTVLLNPNEQSSFQYILKNGKSDKKFFFTATTKILKNKPKISNKSLDELMEEGEEEEKEEDIEKESNIISMDNSEVYGENLLHMRLDEAIESKYLTDYNIILWLYRNDGDKIRSIFNILKRQIGRKILIYCNSVSNVKRVYQSINEEQSEIVRNNIYCNYIIAETKKDDREKILKEFNNNKISILILCNICKTGFDNKLVDTVIHYDKCNSPIDFTQKNGRCLRLCRGKIMSNIIILTNINDNDRDIKYYKNILNMLGEYDYRIKGKMETIKKDAKKKIHNTISINYNEGEDIGDIYSIYDRYMNYISGYNNIIEKTEILIEYRINEGKFPSQRFIYKDIKIGRYFNNLKQKLFKQIKLGEEPIGYKEERDDIIRLFKKHNLYNEVIDSIKVEKKIEDMSTIDRTKLLVEYRTNAGKFPTSKFMYKDIKIGQYYDSLKQKFFKQLKLGEEPIGYKEERDDIIRLFKKHNLYNEVIDSIKVEKKIEDMSTIDKTKLLVEYRTNEGKFPSQNIIYKDIKIGQYCHRLKQKFFKQLKLGGEPIGYKEDKENIISLFKDNNLYDEIIDSIKVEKKIEDMSTIDKTKLLVEYIIDIDKWPTENTVYKDIKIGAYYNRLKHCFFKQLKLGEEPKYYKKERDDIISLFKDNNLYNEIIDSIKVEKKIEDMSTIDRTKLLVEYRTNEGKFPTSKFIYKDVKIGSYYDSLKQRLFKQLKLGEESKYYKKERDDIISLFKDNNLYNEIIDSIKV